MSTRKERKLAKLESIRQQAEAAKEHPDTSPQQEAKKSKIPWIIGAVIVLVAISAIGFAFYNAQKPGLHDGFAQCLSEKGAVMYGASWCQYSQAQRGMFGKSFKYVDYRDFTEGPDIRFTPTWVIGGKKLEKVQSFDSLAQATGCRISP